MGAKGQGKGYVISRRMVRVFGLPKNVGKGLGKQTLEGVARQVAQGRDIVRICVAPSNTFFNFIMASEDDVNRSRGESTNRY